MRVCVCVCVSVFVCACACVCMRAKRRERNREREGEKDRDRETVHEKSCEAFFVPVPQLYFELSHRLYSQTLLLCVIGVFIG